MKLKTCCPKCGVPLQFGDALRLLTAYRSRCRACNDEFAFQFRRSLRSIAIGLLLLPIATAVALAPLFLGVQMDRGANGEVGVFYMVGSPIASILVGGILFWNINARIYGLGPVPPPMTWPLMSRRTAVIFLIGLWLTMAIGAFVTLGTRMEYSGFLYLAGISLKWLALPSVGACLIHRRRVPEMWQVNSAIDNGLWLAPILTGLPIAFGASGVVGWYNDTVPPGPFSASYPQLAGTIESAAVDETGGYRHCAISLTPPKEDRKVQIWLSPNVCNEAHAGLPVRLPFQRGRLGIYFYVKNGDCVIGQAARPLEPKAAPENFK